MDFAVPTDAGPAWMGLDTGNNGPTMIASHVAALVGLKPAADAPQTFAVALKPGLVLRDKVSCET